MPTDRALPRARATRRAAWRVTCCAARGARGLALLVRTLLLELVAHPIAPFDAVRRGDEDVASIAAERDGGAARAEHPDKVAPPTFLDRERQARVHLAARGLRDKARIDLATHTQRDIASGAQRVFRGRAQRCVERGVAADAAHQHATRRALERDITTDGAEPHAAARAADARVAAHDIDLDTALNLVGLHVTADAPDDHVTQVRQTQLAANGLGAQARLPVLGAQIAADGAAERDLARMLDEHVAADGAQHRDPRHQRGVQVAADALEEAGVVVVFDARIAGDGARAQTATVLGG